MAIKWGGFGTYIENKITPEMILALGKSIDDDLATGRRTLSELSKSERQALGFYNQERSKKS